MASSRWPTSPCADPFATLPKPKAMTRSEHAVLFVRLRLTFSNSQSEHILSCFGGAGGQHACAIARALGMKTIFIHRFAGVLSAYGLGLSNLVCEAQVWCHQRRLPCVSCKTNSIFSNLAPWSTAAMHSRLWKRRLQA